MWNQLLAGGLTSLFNFGIHAVITVIIVVVSSRMARHTGHLHVFGRVTVLLALAMLVLMAAHIIEIAVWAGVYDAYGVKIQTTTNFEFAFENYTAVGYGDSLPGKEHRLIGPITSLNGLLLIGWSVAIIFEVMRMAEVRFERPLAARAHAKERKRRMKAR